MARRHGRLGRHKSRSAPIAVRTNQNLEGARNGGSGVRPQPHRPPRNGANVAGGGTGPPHSQNRPRYPGQGWASRYLEQGDVGPACTERDKHGTGPQRADGRPDNADHRRHWRHRQGDRSGPGRVGCTPRDHRPGPRAHRGCGPRDPHGRRRPGGTFSSRTSRGCGGWLARYSGGCPGSMYWSTTSAGTRTPGTSPLTAPALVNALVIALLGGLR